MQSIRTNSAEPPIHYSKEQGDKVKVNGVYANETNVGEITEVKTNNFVTGIYLSCYDGDYCWCHIGSVINRIPLSPN